MVCTCIEEFLSCTSCMLHVRPKFTKPVLAPPFLQTNLKAKLCNGSLPMRLAANPPFVGLGPVQLDLPYTTPKVTLTVQGVYNTQAQLSHGRGEVIAMQLATKEVVRVVLHPAHGHVGGGLGKFAVQPDGDVLQLCALQLVHGAGIAWAQGVGSDVAAVLHIVRQGIDREVAPSLRHSMDALGCWIIGLDGCLHPVDEVGLLVDIARDVQPHTLVERHLQCLRRRARDQLVLVVLQGGARKAA